MITLILPFHGFMKSRIRVSLLYKQGGIMSLKDQLKEDMKAAMKAREEGKIALSVIRMVNSAIKNTEINDKIELDDAGILGILAKEMKTR